MNRQKISANILVFALVFEEQSRYHLFFFMHFLNPFHYPKFFAKAL